MATRSDTRGTATRVLAFVASTVLFATCAVTALGAFGIGTDRIRIVTVATGSMAPDMPVDTMVVAVPATAVSVTVGQVIVFMPPPDFTTPGALPVVHRVAAIATVNDVLEIRTKGDANAVIDPWVLDAEHTTLFTPMVTSLAAGRVVGGLGAYGLPALALLLVLTSVRVALRRIWRAPDELDAVPAYAGEHLSHQW